MNPSTLHRFGIDLSDSDRNVYEALELRVARHPSESVPYLLTRVLAYALNYSEHIQFSAGLSKSEEPAITLNDLTGTRRLWIEIGNPSPERLLKASKASERVRVYTYKNPELLLSSIPDAIATRLSNTEIFSFGADFLREIEVHLGRRNSWSLVYSQGDIYLGVEGQSIHGQVKSHALPCSSPDAERTHRRL